MCNTLILLLNGFLLLYFLLTCSFTHSLIHSPSSSMLWYDPYYKKRKFHLFVFSNYLSLSLDQNNYSRYQRKRHLPQHRRKQLIFPNYSMRSQAVAATCCLDSRNQFPTVCMERDYPKINPIILYSIGYHSQEKMSKRKRRIIDLHTISDSAK